MKKIFFFIVIGFIGFKIFNWYTIKQSWIKDPNMIASVIMICDIKTKTKFNSFKKHTNSMEAILYIKQGKQFSNLDVPSKESFATCIEKYTNNYTAAEYFKMLSNKEIY